MDMSNLHSVFERVQEGRLFEQYRNAFRAATGLPLSIVRDGEKDWQPCSGSGHDNPFCKELNTNSHVCEACVAAAIQLSQKFPCEAPSRSITCFAGMQETAVPIRLGENTFAFLKTGEVFEKKPEETDFDRVIELLEPLGYSSQRLEALHAAYFDTPVVEGPRYEGVVALLATFAEHLQRHVEEQLLVEENSEPESVRRAKTFIQGNYRESIHLPVVAAHAGVSQHHFSRIFKSATGLSFTDYVARCRVRRAKEELLKPNARVTEVAFDVGFQSLSQFNRSFARLAGETPTRFRRRKLKRGDRAAG